MVTGFDYLSRDKALQEHWLRRFVALVIDALIRGLTRKAE